MSLRCIPLPIFAASIWDPRADLDDDGDVDATDESLFDAKRPTWDPTSIDFGSGPTVSQAFSDVDNPYAFQGVPHFALDTAANATTGKLMLNHHRARISDPVIAQWTSADPLIKNYQILNPYVMGVRILRKVGLRASHKSMSDTKLRAKNGIQRVDSYLYLETPTTKLDPTGLIVNLAEVAWCCRNPICCPNAFIMREGVEDYLRVIYGQTGSTHDGGVVNAVKHSTWMCATAGLSTCDCEDAQGLGRAHEYGSGDHVSSNMDLHNNRQGLLVSGCSGESGGTGHGTGSLGTCHAGCQERANDCSLVWNNTDCTGLFGDEREWCEQANADCFEPPPSP